jgi:hypothetical protein
MGKYFTKKYVALFLCFGFALLFTIIFFTKDKIKSEKDLLEIRGPLADFSFRDNTGFRNRGRQYDIKLGSFNNTFRIKADYLGDFYKYEFLNYVNKGDILIITIPKSKIGKLNSGNRIFLTSIQIKDRTFLNKRTVIEIENSYFLLLGAAGFLMLGFLIFRFAKNYY